ncbi:MAG: D-aminoacyl-tRNA deacylase [Methanomassiliicoccales archaeon]|nr:D-aminoacyl-tRNA deacylase [Methanomassiliicoccales archaeon]
MRLLVCALDDIASVNIRDRLLELYQWSGQGSFRGNEVRTRGRDVLVTIPGLHLFADGLDKEAAEALGIDVERVVFLSRHKAASGIPTLTVHPIGNYGKAEFGGKEGVLVPSDPDAMTCSLRALQRNGQGLGFQISYEVTHHGPLLSTPTMFIEIGSAEGNWGHVEAAEAIARTLMETEVVSAPRAIGVGGGHYAPRFSELIMTKKVSFGHMIPGYFSDKASDEELMAAMRKAIDATEGARYVYVHKKSMSRSRATHIRELAASLGAKAIDSDDLEDLPQ